MVSHLRLYLENGLDEIESLGKWTWFHTDAKIMGLYQNKLEFIVKFIILKKNSHIN